MTAAGNKTWFRVRKIFRILVIIHGILFLLLLFFSFTRVPYDVHRWLGTHQCSYQFYPDEIILLGGSGMPGGDNLLRLYYASALSNKYPQAKVLIVHPKDENVIGEMKAELLLRGVDSSKIEIENAGTNTHNQALHVAKDLPRLLRQNILLVTSPESMYRAVSTFRKTGFESVGGHAAFETPMFVDLDYDFKKSGGKNYSPDVSGNLALRYNFWNYLKLEISCLREFAALGYYWINGWI